MPAPVGNQPQLMTALFEEHRDRLRGMLWGLLRNPDQVDDVLQTVFTKALESAAGVQAEALKAWLFQVAYNDAMLIRRKAGVQQRAFQKLASEMSRSGESWPGEAIARQERQAQIQNALLRIPPEQQEVVRRRIQDDQTFQEIASELNVPLGTVLTRMRLALEKLRSALRLPVRGESDQHV